MTISFIGPAYAPVFALSLCLACGSSVWAGAQAKPVCAFIDSDRAPRAALLEAKLLGDGQATWVERNAIDGVLKEQALQAAFGPQGGADRIRLGKLLKADLLVLVRPLKSAKEPALELVVSDTSRGLRLALRAVPVTQDAAADVAALRLVVEAGLRKYRENVREVVAVPPFASANLEYAHDHLKGAYAKLVEQAALANPGVVVVELAEAEAIAREIKLADPGATVKRPLPLYLLGEYRHQGRGVDLKVALKLQATRGGQSVGPAVTEVVAPAEAPARLHKWTAERLAADKAGPAPTPDPKAEARQLAELVRSRQRVGDWADALALLEASLLLDRDQPEMNADAMVMLRYWIEEILGQERKQPDRLRRAAQLHRRGLEHMETLISGGAKLPRFQKYPLPKYGRAFDSTFPFPVRRDPYVSYPLPPDPAEAKAIIDELEKDRRAAYLRILPYAVKDGLDREVVKFVRDGVGETRSPAERFAEYGRLILEHQESKAMIAALAQILVPFGAYTPPDFQEYRTLLDRLDKEGNKGVRDAVRNFRLTLPNSERMAAERAAEAAERKRKMEAAAKNPPKGPVVRANPTRAELDFEIDEKLKGGPLRRIALTVASSDDDWFIDHVRGVVAAGPGIDVFWATARFPHARPGDDPDRPKVGGAWIRSGPALLVMKEKGVLRRVFARPGAPEKITDACFDGRFVWISTEESRKAPALFVLDPVNERAYEVTFADGLPEPPAEFTKDPRRSEALSLKLAPLDPGRVCVSGWFGRAWVGIAAFDRSAGKTSVKVIHEAREAPRQGEKEPWLSPNLSFVPAYALTVRGPGAEGKAPLRVLIGRGWPISQIRVNEYLPQMGPHPLVVDPDGKVEVLHTPAPAAWQVKLYVAPAGGTHYVAYPRGGGGPTVNLFRFEYPGKVVDLGQLAVSPVSTDMPCGVLGDRLVLAPLNFGGKATLQPGGSMGWGSSWWTADLDGKNLHKQADEILHVRALHRSSHYGLVAWCDLAASIPRLACCEVLPARSEK